MYEIAGDDNDVHDNVNGDDNDARFEARSHLVSSRLGASKYHFLTLLVGRCQA